MKKSILLIAALFSFAVMVTSCKEAKKEEVKTEEHKNHDHDKEHEKSTADAYKCPMDCEKGKSYDKEGDCPVCKMDLKKQKGDSNVKHSDSCKCKEGGECKCEPGKCKCQETVACEKCGEGECKCKGNEVAEKAKDCKMCEPGDCKCKA